MAIIPAEPSRSLSNQPGPTGRSARPLIAAVPGPAGMGANAQTGEQAAHSDPFAVKPGVPRTDAVSLLRRLEAFKLVHDEVTQNLGTRIVEDPKRSVRRAAGQGAFDYFANTIEFPPEVFSAARSPSQAVLELVAHEFRHAYQMRGLLQEAKQKGGTEEIRTAIYDSALDRMGEAEFLHEYLEMEVEAERFAVKIALQALGSHHAGPKAYQEVFGVEPTRAQYVSYILKTWWEANGDTYRAAAEAAWKDHVGRKAAKGPPAQAAH